MARIRDTQGYWHVTPIVLMLSNGVKRPASEEWDHDIPGADWVVFGDPDAGRALFLAKHEEDDVADQYWPMKNDMTVFGFGRKRHSRDRLLTGPGKFSVGLIEWTDFEKARSTIEGIYRDATIEVGAAEARER